MKYAVIVILAVLVVIAVAIFQMRYEEGVSGESSTIGDSFVVAEYGYARGGDVLLYAVIRSFPTNATPDQKSNDPRYRETDSGTEVRNANGQMIPVGRDGTVYLFDRNNLRTMKVKVGEPDIGIGNCQSMDEIWANFKKFEIQTNK